MPHDLSGNMERLYFTGYVFAGVGVLTIVAVGFVFLRWTQR